MSQKNVLVIIGSVIVLALLGWAIAAMNSDSDDETLIMPTPTASPTVTAAATITPSPAATAAATATPAAANLTVTYNGSAFSPATLTITKGQTVTFTNNSNGGMWIASDPHPVHTDFSAFDARKSYAKGTSYTFTFNQTGTFDYHDHLNDDVKGTIVVQ